MEKLFKNIVKLFALSAIIVLASCGDDETPLPNAPTITVNSTQFGTSTSYEATAGETISLSFTINAPGGFNNYKADVIVNGTGSSSPITESKSPGTTVETFTSQNITFEATEELVGATIVFQIDVTDDNNLTTSATLDLTVVSAPINSFTAKLFGAQGNSNPGFYNVLDDQLLTYAEARDASGVTSSTVDFAYYWGANNNSTIASIDDTGLNSVYTAVSLPIDGVFGTKNSTLFKELTTTASDFDNITTLSQLQDVAVFEVGGTTSASLLAVGDVIAFKLDTDRGGNFGLIKVVSVDDTNGNGTITIDVKVQK